NLLDRFGGFDLHQDFALLHPFTDGLQPACHGSLFDTHSGLRQIHFDRRNAHRSFLTAATMRSWSGYIACSRTGLNGTCTSGAVRRTMGLRRLSNASSTTRAAISE